MRELTPDRPDKTESPYTLDAGHFQLEMDFANYTYDKSDGTDHEGLERRAVQPQSRTCSTMSIFSSFSMITWMSARKTAAPAQSITQSGVGDFTTRLKINLWGDDGGKTAFALLPFVKFPTSTDNLGNDAVEGGVIFPLAVKLPDGFDLGLETAVSFLRDDSDSNYHADFINSITLDHAIMGKLSGYLEFFSDISAESHAGWIGTVDTGLEFLVTRKCAARLRVQFRRHARGG